MGLTAITGGLSLAQFVGVFRTPMQDLHENLRRPAEFRMKLEPQP